MALAARGAGNGCAGRCWVVLWLRAGEVSAAPQFEERPVTHGLSGAVVVLTGASSGIGLATARAFAREGARLVLAARGDARLDEAVASCASLGAEALAVPTDVADAAQMDALAEAAVGRFGRIDVWVNDAGTSLWGPFEEIPVEVHARLVEVDLLGALNGCAAAVPRMLAAGGSGVIINVVSIGGRLPSPWAASYSAAKYGLAGLTDALRAELALRSKIAVCGVYPAFVDTPTHLASGNYTGRALRPVPPVAFPEKVAERIVGLAVRPRRAVRIGALNAATVLHSLAPDTIGRLMARLGRRYLLRSGPLAPFDRGALFSPALGPAAARGDWGLAERARARRAVVTLGVGLAGASAAIASWASRRGVAP
jgi:NAD(P)-dependent dehydrogenase (short-subunit alcohol dehydrogenase family)